MMSNHLRKLSLLSRGALGYAFVTRSILEIWLDHGKAERRDAPVPANRPEVFIRFIMQSHELPARSLSASTASPPRPPFPAGTWTAPGLGFTSSSLG